MAIVINNNQIPSILVDTDTVPKSERVDYWRSSLCGLCDMTFGSVNDWSEFSGRSESWMLGKVVLRKCVTSAHRLERSARRIRHDQIDHYSATLLLSGAGRVDGDAGSEEMRKKWPHASAGECVLGDMAQPSRIYVGAGERITIFVPRDLLDPLLTRRVDLHGIVLRGPIAEIFFDHLKSLVGNLPLIGLNQAIDVTTSTLHLMAASLLPTIDTFALANPVVGFTFRRKICTYIDGQIMQPDLTIDSICKKFAVSRSTLFRIFEPFGGVASYIKERRLFHVHGHLMLADRHISLDRVAGDYGFKTASHFSRSFREQFGYSPRECLKNRGDALARPILRSGRDSLFQWLGSIRG
ncbi:helix-turn-helix domain-containing protein [Burkholderia sp. JSH-S8]|nr:helix-turn-helix domain-containing protein [Burkholderia sp. JSH-S8]